MCDEKKVDQGITDRDKLEYQEAMAMHRADSALRRQGLAFASGIQVLVIAAFSKSVITSPFQSFTLASLACLVCLVSWNQDLRLSKYISTYETRMLEIEQLNNLRLMSLAEQEVDQKWFPLSNKTCFGILYKLTALGWFLTILVQVGLISLPGEFLR